MSVDGGLRPLFAKRLPEAHWQAVETWAIASGVPDANYCFPGGIEGWIEFKLTKGDRVGIRPQQVAWVERRCRVGGRTWLIVRKKHGAGPRRIAVDTLFLYRGENMRAVLLNGLSERPAAKWDGGIAQWDWAEIKGFLRS
jgi:hypothetical protein